MALHPQFVTLSPFFSTDLAELQNSLARCRTAREVRALLRQAEAKDRALGEVAWSLVAEHSPAFDAQIVDRLCRTPAGHADRVLDNPRGRTAAGQVFEIQLSKVRGTYRKKDEARDWVGAQVGTFASRGWIRADSPVARELEEIAFDSPAIVPSVKDGLPHGNGPQRLAALEALIQVPDLPEKVLLRCIEQPRQVYLWQLAARSPRATPHLWAELLRAALSSSEILCSTLAYEIGGHPEGFRHPEVRGLLQKVLQRTRDRKVLAVVTPNADPTTFRFYFRQLLEHNPLQAAECLEKTAEENLRTLTREDLAELLQSSAAPLREAAIRAAHLASPPAPSTTR